MRSALLLLVVIAPLLGAEEVEAAQPEITAVAAEIADRRVAVIIDLPGVQQRPVPPESFSVRVNGISQSGQVGPLLSGELALSFVIDASEAGGTALPEGARGVATFLLALSPSTRSAVVVDASPPAVSAPLQQGPTATLRALTTLRPRGGRTTSDALGLGLQELPPGAADPSIVVLYTAAPDAGGEPAVDLVKRLHAAGVPLSVVAAVADGQPVPQYWSTVAAATGGVAIAAPPAQAAAAFEQLATSLRSRYLMRFPLRTAPPATAVIRVDTPTGALSTDLVIPAQTTAPAASATASAPAAYAVQPVGAVLAVGLGVGLVVLIIRVMLRQRSSPAGGRRAEAGNRPVPASAGEPWNIPSRWDMVAGRDALLATVRSTLDAGEPALLHAPDSQVGTGTTTVMIEFAHRYRDRYDIAWWISAEDPALVPDRMAELADALGLADATDGAELATARLLEALSHRDRWLLVFDDAESPRELTRFLPDGSGDVVVISQKPEWRERAVPILVPAFTRTESVDLLRSRLPYVSVEEADRVGSALDDLPLAVGPAAAMLADTGMSMRSYLRQLSDRRAKLQLAGDADSGSVAASWGITFDRLRADDPAALALLTLVAWLGSEPTPLWLLTRNPGELPTPLANAARDPAELVERAVMLRRRGLAQVARRSVWLHREPAALLVSQTVDERIDGAEWPAIAIRLLRAAVPENPRDPASWPAWRLLLPHVVTATDPARPLAALASEVGWLLGSAATYLQARGEPQAASALFEDAEKILRRQLGANHPDTLACARELTANRLAIGQQESASG